MRSCDATERTWRRGNLHPSEREGIEWKNSFLCINSTTMLMAKFISLYKLLENVLDINGTTMLLSRVCPCLSCLRNSYFLVTLEKCNCSFKKGATASAIALFLRKKYNWCIFLGWLRNMNFSCVCYLKNPFGFTYVSVAWEILISQVPQKSAIVV
jgi:hypothetical protein